MFGMLAQVGIIGWFFIGLYLVDLSLAIVGGGIEAIPNEFPWAVRLEGCGGALISDRHILTAAHCLSATSANANSTWVYLGGHTGPHVVNEAIINEPYSIFLPSIKRASFPFERKTYERFTRWDIALLEIEPINFTSTIRSIKLAKRKPQLGSTVTLAGWGFLNRSKLAHALHKIDLQVTDDCGVRDRFCAKHPNAQFELKDACNGDSGSPLMLRHDSDNEWLLVGVMTAGKMSDKEDCEKLGGYSAYADLSFKNIRNWIEEVVGAETFF